ncbi:MAG: hypothetical protein GKR94_02645 [Gammaproteobacteria bacterium]|nr:hypothetical protein [Gammaproteobacteria bacterium]
MSQPPSSLSESALRLGAGTVKSQIVNSCIRQRTQDKEDWSAYKVELEALAALGLAQDGEFRVLERLRLFGGRQGGHSEVRAKVLQAAYFNPAYIPEERFAAKDFSTDSLAQFYTELGYTRLPERPRRFRSRSASVGEKVTLGESLRIAGAILEVRQITYARAGRCEQVFALEYLCSRYLDWDYDVPGYLDGRPWYEYRSSQCAARDAGRF